MQHASPSCVTSVQTHWHTVDDPNRLKTLIHDLLRTLSQICKLHLLHVHIWARLLAYHCLIYQAANFTYTDTQDKQSTNSRTQ